MSHDTPLFNPFLICHRFCLPMPLLSPPHYCSCLVLGCCSPWYFWAVALFLGFHCIPCLLSSDLLSVLAASLGSEPLHLDSSHSCSMQIDGSFSFILLSVLSTSVTKCSDLNLKSTVIFLDSIKESPAENRSV